MNRHETLYRTSVRWLIAFVVLWASLMAFALVIPRAWQSETLTFILFTLIGGVLFVSAIILLVVNLVAYVRWTGKYPYYFLFRKSRELAALKKKEREKQQSEEN